MAFDRFIAIDWTGARGQAHKGLAVAEVNWGNGTPRLVQPPDEKFWSRRAIGQFLQGLAAGPGRALVGIDTSFAFPFDDMGAYFPGACFPGAYFPGTGRPGAAVSDARALWAAVDGICGAPADQPDDLYGGAFVDHPAYSRFFRRVGRVGADFSPRLRLTEAACAAQGLGRAQSVFHLIGPAQVGLGSLAAMRMLHHLRQAAPAVSVWPFDPMGGAKVVIVEIYTRLFLTHAGAGVAKIRTAGDLDAALARLGLGPWRGEGRLDDHTSDALVSAAGLRALVRRADRRLWAPSGVDEACRRREGWTFGVLSANLAPDEQG